MITLGSLADGYLEDISEYQMLDSKSVTDLLDWTYSEQANMDIETYMDRLQLATVVLSRPVHSTM